MGQLTSLVYDYAKSWANKEYQYISPSSLGGCMRAHYFKLVGVPMTTPPNVGALLNFELGRQWEKPIEDALRYHQLPFMSQLTLTDEEFGVQGTPDIMLYDPCGGDWELVSIKTESVRATDYRRRAGESYFNSNHSYAIQEACYKLLAEKNEYKIKDTARYIVVTKDNGLLTEEVLLFTDDLMKETSLRIKTLRTALNESKVPPCECEGWKVEYCSFGDPTTLKKSKTGKVVNSTCCSLELLNETK